MYELFFRFPGGTDRAVTLSYDDGVEQDQRIIALLKSHRMKGTFNINGNLFHPENTPHDPNKIARRFPESKIREIYLNETAEVAIHGFRHMWMACLPKGAAAYEIVEDRKKLEEITDSLVTGGSYAHGSYNEEAIRALDACGIEYCLTVKATHNFLLPERWLTWHPTRCTSTA